MMKVSYNLYTHGTGRTTVSAEGPLDAVKYWMSSARIVTPRDMVMNIAVGKPHHDGVAVFQITTVNHKVSYKHLGRWPGERGIAMTRGPDSNGVLP